MKTAGNLGRVTINGVEYEASVEFYKPVANAILCRHLTPVIEVASRICAQCEKDATHRCYICKELLCSSHASQHMDTKGSPNESEKHKLLG